MADGFTTPQIPDALTPFPDDVEYAALVASYPKWKITRAAFGGYRAEHRSESGLTIKYIAADSAADLASRLLAVTAAAQEAAEQE